MEATDTQEASVVTLLQPDAHTRSISTTTKKNKPCPPSKCVSWPRAPVESCLVHTVDLISPEGTKHNQEIRGNIKCDASVEP